MQWSAMVTETGFGSDAFKGLAEPPARPAHQDLADLEDREGPQVLPDPLARPETLDLRDHAAMTVFAALRGTRDRPDTPAQKAPQVRPEPTVILDRQVPPARPVRPGPRAIPDLRAIRVRPVRLVLQGQPVRQALPARPDPRGQRAILARPARPGPLEILARQVPLE